MIAASIGRRVAAVLLAGAAAVAVVAVVPMVRAADGASPPAGRKSIFDFDDDDKPERPAAAAPERTPGTTPTPDTPETKPAEPEKTAPETPAPSSSSSPGSSLKIVLPPAVRDARPVSPPVVRAQTLMSVPDPKAQEQALRRVKEQFKAEYRATGAERAVGARKLLEAGAGAQGDAETSFVLLKEARDMASSAGDARTGLVAARQIAGRYDVDLTEMGLAVLQAAGRNANTADRAADVAVVAMTLLGRAADARQFDLAIRIASVAEASARVMRSTALTNNLAAVVKDLRARKQVADKLPAALDAAKANPSDPEACAVIGRHACLEEGNWAEGLAFLAKGNDAALKNLAAREAAVGGGGPTEPMAQAELGNQWWTAAQSQPVTARLRMQERAAYWYGRAMPGLLGARKDQAAARVAAAHKVLPEVVLMPVAVPADAGKARREREALGGAEPMGKTSINESVLVPTGKAYLLSDKTAVPDKGDRVDITLGPGAELRGGKLYLAGRGHLVVRGSAEKPAVLRNVHVSMDLNGSFTAEYAVIENCTFAKAGGWYSGFSSKWTFKNCVLYRCKFNGLDATNYGFRMDDCRLIGMTFPEVTYKRDAAKEFNHLDHLRKEWNHVAGCEFDDCVLPPTVAWCAEDSNFIGCKFLPGEAFEGAENFEWRAFVAETNGESPQAVWDARPGPRGRVKYVPLERPVDVPQVGPRLIPEVTYATKAVVRNE